MRLLFAAFVLNLLAALLFAAAYANGAGGGYLLVSVISGLMALCWLSTLLNKHSELDSN